MKIVLRQDVPKLGEAGSVQDVSNGYARNYLIPRGLAVVATKGELKVVAENQRVRARKIARQEEQLQSFADRIAGKRLSFTARSGEQGRLYGSITVSDIAEKLSEEIGEEIDRRKVILDEPIRTVGEHVVTVNVVGRLRPQVTVVVSPEKGVPDASGEEETSHAAATDVSVEGAAEEVAEEMEG